MTLPNEQLDLVVAAMLAANKFSLVRAQDLVPKLRVANLLDPTTVCSLELGPLTVQLASAGYDRGMLTSMFAERLQGLIQAVRDGALDAIPEAVAKNDEKAAVKLLSAVKGIGPEVARTAWVLLRAVGTTDPASV